MTTIPANGPTLLLTRPKPAAEAFATALGDWPGPIVLSPLLDIVPVMEPAPELLPRSVIFTSKNAVHFYQGPTDVAGYCVGEATTATAKAKGFDAQYVGADAEELITRLPGIAPEEPLIHVRGRHVAQPVALELSKAGVPCAEWVVYDQVANTLNTRALAALAGVQPVVLPVFSPRSAHILSACLTATAPQAPCVLVAISSNVASRITADWPDASVLTAAAPNAEAMRTTIHASARHARALEGKSPLA